MARQRSDVSTRQPPDVAARHPGNEEPPAKRAGLQFHDVKQRNLSCRICVGAGDAPLNSPLSFARRVGTAV